MIDYKYFDLFNADSVDKQFYIEYPGGTVTNEDLFSESIEITESLCSESSLRFGCCEASCLKFKVANIYNLSEGAALTVSVVLSQDEADPFVTEPTKSDRFVIGKYRVKTSVLTPDNLWREVTAYDDMYDMLNTDVSDWYNSVLPEESSTMELWEFRGKFAQYFGISEHLPDGGLVNDDMIVTRTIAPDQLSGKDVITAICEINGCFGHIGRDGKLHYIYLGQYVQGLYPANDLYPDHAPDYLPYQQETGHLYPQDPKYVNIGQNKNYIDLKCEDFETKKITKLQIRDDENSAGILYPDGGVTNDDNCYTIQGNFLVYGKTYNELRSIAENIYSKITGIIYRPFSLEVRANPCAEVGDSVRVSTEYRIVESYIMSRTMKGLQAFVDSISASGTEKYEENVNSVRSSIEQLRGKTNVLTRNVEETRSEISDLENSTNSRFVQTANEIQAEVTARQGEDSDIRASLSMKIDNTDDGTIISLIEGSADRIHFNANNMFTVDSPYFKVNETGQLELGGDITADTSLYLTYQLLSTENPVEIDSLNVSTGGFTEFSIYMDGDRPYSYLGSSYIGTVVAPILNLGDGARIIKTSVQFQPSSIFSATAIFSECVLTNANIHDLYLDTSTGANGGTLYKCNGGFGNDGIASAGWVKNYVSANMPSAGISHVDYEMDSSDTTKYAPRFFDVNGTWLNIRGLLVSTSSSDVRLKDNIKDMRDIKAIYMSIRPVEYEWKQGYITTQKGLQFGIIAQELEKTLQDYGIFDSGLVLKERAEEDEKNIHGDEYTHKLDKENLHAMHIQMIQSQEKKIENLITENMILSGRVAILEQKMEEILNAINHKDN